MAENPFTDADFEDMRARMRDLDEADKLVARAEQAGLDVTDKRKQSKELREQMLKIQRAFFPGKSLLG